MTILTDGKEPGVSSADEIGSLRSWQFETSVDCSVR